MQEAQSTPGAPAASTLGKRRHLLGLAWLLPVLLPSAAVGCWRLQGAAPSDARGRHPNTGLRSTSSMSPRAAAQRCVRPHACRSDAQPLWAQPLDIHSRSLPRGSPKPPRLPQPPATDGAQGYSTAAGEQEPLGEPPAPVGVVTLHWCSQAIHRAAGSCQQHEGRVVTRDSSLLMLLQMKT